MSQNYPRFSHYANKRLHIGICGSVAAYKMADLMRRFQECNILVSITLTPSAQKFISPLTFEALGASIIYTEMFVNDTPFSHLEPGQMADAMLIAPASAATLSRLSMGAADEMLACQALAFDGPILIAPAMNPRMWANPATAHNVETLVDRGYFLTEPEVGLVACQETGAGRLADLRQIYLETLKLLTEQDLFGKKVMVTLGPTQEKWDAVRVWTNNSTGNMGTAFALAAWLRGAEVHAIAGPVNQFMPKDENFFRHNIESAQDMHDACADLWEKMDIGIFTAAVADFKPMPHTLHHAHPTAMSLAKKTSASHISAMQNTYSKTLANNMGTSGIGETDEMNGMGTLSTMARQENHDEFTQTKFKKENHKNGFNLSFQPNMDILKTLGAKKARHQKIIGFAAESGSNMTELSMTVQKKLLSKNCDVMVGNFINEAIGADKNRVFVATNTGKAEPWPSMPKTSLAWDLLSHLNGL